MNTSLIIIDNFYDEPDIIRDLALSSKYYPEKVSKGYPNGNAPWSGKMSKDAYSPSWICLLYTSPSPRDKRQSRMPSSA